MTTTDPLPDIFDLRADDPLGEALLLQAVRDGSTAAFGILYARYRTFAVGVALRALSRADLATAEDVAEAAFIRVLTALRNGKGPTDTLRAYLTTTVRREVWRAQRRIGRQAEVVDRWASDERRSDGAEVSPLPVDTADLTSHALLEEAFRGLSERWRHVLWLTEVEGRKPAEVAPMLGVSAGSVSALAYRARSGLVAAYIAAYQRRTDDAACLAIAGRLGEYVVAGAPPEGYADVLTHLDGCAACRDVSRGVDVFSTALASFAPFGLLTAGLWAKSAGVGAAGLAGATAAGVAGHAVGGSTAGSTSGGMGIAGGVAAAAAVAVVAGAAWAGLVRSAPDSGAAPRPPTTTIAERPAGAGSPAPASRPVPSSAPAAGASGEPAAPDGPAVDDPTTTTTRAERATTTGVEPPTPVTAATPSAVPGTGTKPIEPTSTTAVIEPPVSDGILTGRAIEAPTQVSDVQRPVDGVGVVAYDDQGRLAATGGTGADGRWQIGDLPPGHYLVIAVVPAAYRLATGDDPWTGGATWATILGSVDVADTPIDLVDLRLIPRRAQSVARGSR